MEKFFLKLLGGIPPLDFLGFLLWAAVGVFVLMQIHANTRDVNSSRTPVAFSWRVFFTDNVRRFAFNAVLIFIALRFTPELFGFEITDWKALLIGLSSDGLAWFLNQFRIAKLSGTMNQKGRQP